MQTAPLQNAEDRAALRHAGPDDAAALALIGGATFLDTYAGLLPGAALVAHCERYHVTAAWQELLRTQGVSCFLAEASGGAPIGYAVVSIPDLPGQRPGDVELRRIYVLSRWRRCGLGKALLALADAEARRRGALRLLLGVWERNEAARGFYQRQGFDQVGTRQFSVGPMICDDLVLGRRVAARI